MSWHQDEYDALGIPFDRRGELLDEQLEIWTKACSSPPISFKGEHYSFNEVWLEPQPVTPGGPALWFGRSTVHPRPLNRLVRYGKGFNPLGQPDEANLKKLAAAMKAAGRDPAELEYVGGTRGGFPSPDQPASLDQAWQRSQPQPAARLHHNLRQALPVHRQSASEFRAFCRDLVSKVSRLT